MRRSEPPREETAGLARQVAELALPLHTAGDLDPLLEQIGDARYVLLGEASHGTHEYYTWRAEISKRLIREKGFSFLAVEGDWPDCYRLNRYLKDAPGAGRSAHEVLFAFDRWPTWMWANREIEHLAEWLRDHNQALPAERRVGFYGLDVYSLWDSMHAVLGYLEQQDPELARTARKAYSCFDPYAEDVQEYARATRWVEASCERQVIDILSALRREGPPPEEGPNREAYFNAEQNALVARNAEHYYRIMVRGGPESWNLRDRHMVETLERLMAFHGPEARAIIWEHNTHVGDARATDMARSGMLNVGQLVRERHATEGVVLVGFGSYRGSVIAGQEWEAPMERMPVPPARPGSWEAVLHEAGAADKLLLLGGRPLPEALHTWRGHRAIGVVYQPEFEAYGNYVPTALPQRYDAFLYLDRTHALQPLHLHPRVEHEVPETYPSGV